MGLRFGAWRLLSRRSGRISFWEAEAAGAAAARYPDAAADSHFHEGGLGFAAAGAGAD
jgi:hypothetical protein